MGLLASENVPAPTPRPTPPVHTDTTQPRVNESTRPERPGRPHQAKQPGSAQSHWCQQSTVCPSRQSGRPISAVPVGSRLLLASKRRGRTPKYNVSLSRLAVAKTNAAEGGLHGAALKACRHSSRWPRGGGTLTKPRPQRGWGGVAGKVRGLLSRISIQSCLAFFRLM